MRAISLVLDDARGLCNPRLAVTMTSSLFLLDAFIDDSDTMLIRRAEQLFCSVAVEDDAAVLRSGTRVARRRTTRESGPKAFRKRKPIVRNCF